MCSRADWRKKVSKDMTKGMPAKLILGFAGPLILGNIFQQFYNMADAVIVGRFVGQEALAAVGATGSTTFLLVALMMGLTNGAGIIISQYYGAEEYVNMRKSIISLAFIILLLSILTSLTGVLASRRLLMILNTPESILDDAVLYMRILFSGVFGIAAYNMCGAVLRSIGDSKTPLYALVLSSAINVGLDLLFVITFGWGVGGAAAATVISQTASAVFCIAVIKKKHKVLHPQKNEIHIDAGRIRMIFRMGLPTAMQSSLIALSNMSVQSLVNGFGAVTLAAYTAAGKIDSIAIQLVVSIGMAMSVYSGQNVGAGNFDRVIKGLKHTLAIMVSGCVLTAVMIVLFKESLLGLFLRGDEASAAISIGSEYLIIVSVAYVIAGIMQSFLNLIRGAGDMSASIFAGIIELSARVLFSFVLSAKLGSTGLWIAIPLSWGCACLYTIFRYSTGKWKEKSVVAKAA